MYNKIIKSLKTINFKLFVTLLITGLIPTIYTTVRIFFLGNLPGDWGFNIASQLQWVNLLYEIIQEALILPLFFLIGMSLLNHEELTNKIRTGLVVTLFIYGTLSLLISIFAYPLVEFMAQGVDLIDTTVTYIRWETLANVFMTAVQFVIMVLVTMKKDKDLFKVLGLQMALTILFDALFLSQLPFSLNLGVNGIAYTNIIVNVGILALVLFLLSQQGISVFKKGPWAFSWMKQWLKVGFYSGLESFVRNIAFMLMVVRMVNVVGEQGTFWVANNFIWGWLLLPVLQLGSLIKRDCAEEGNRAIVEKTLGYGAITTLIVVVWLISIPLWEPFIRNIMNVSSASEVYEIALISVVFYITFAYNNIIDSIFYGIGKTQYMLFQSIVINAVFYGTLYVLYTIGVYQPTLTLIALMFASGIAFDSILTAGMFLWMLKKRNLSIIK